MSSIHISTARGQKRKRSKVDSESTSPSEPQWKKGGFRSAEEANTAFWDNLSKVPLCPHALRELDRRNWLSVGSITKSVVARSAGPITRSATRSAARRAAQRSTLLKESAAQLKRFARRGGPNLHDLRGYSEFSETIMSSKKILSSDSSGKRTSAYYHPGFEQNLIDHNVYPCFYEYPDDRTVKPKNWNEIQQQLKKSRPSLSLSQFSEKTFSDYQQKTIRAANEADIMINTFPILKGNSDVLFGTNKRFTNLTPLTDGTIVNAQPDFYCGARLDQLDPHVQKELGSYIIPSKNKKAPILPNNFTEGKGPRGTIAVAERQTCYDGAIGARAIQKLQSYNQEPVYDNNAYTITSTFDGRYLQIFTTHPTAPTKPGGQPEYHTNKLNGWDMTGNPEAFLQGATWYRNASDWTKEKRDEFIEAANERAAIDRMECD